MNFNPTLSPIGVKINKKKDVPQAEPELFIFWTTITVPILVEVEVEVV